jgi:hypothetical protein
MSDTLLEKYWKMYEETTSETRRAVIQQRIFELMEGAPAAVPSSAPASSSTASSSSTVSSAGPVAQEPPYHPYRCPVAGCGKLSCNAERLASHRNSKSCYGNQDPCPHCEDQQPHYTEAALRGHIKQKHKDVNQAPSKYLCPHCKVDQAPSGKRSTSKEYATKCEELLKFHLRVCRATEQGRLSVEQAQRDQDAGMPRAREWAEENELTFADDDSCWTMYQRKVTNAWMFDDIGSSAEEIAAHEEDKAAKYKAEGITEAKEKRLIEQQYSHC